MVASKRLNIKSKTECKWDEVSLGEVMIRLDPGDMRIRTTRNFQVWEGGGEYNVARALRKCFGLRTSIVTGIVENEIGYLLEDMILQGGVDTSYIKLFPYDGIGREVRVGLNFTERGFGIRGSIGVSDRANSATSKLKRGDVDWERIFKKDGVRWFHTGGIFAALSKTTPDIALEAIEYAKDNATIISYDLNYRPSLWKSLGGSKRAIEINTKIAKCVDVLFGNEEDFTLALGLKIDGFKTDSNIIDLESFKKMITSCLRYFPNVSVVATSLRLVKTATINDWNAIIYYDDQFYSSTKRENLEIYDRIGGGDSFASGVIYGFLSNKPLDEIVEYGAAHGALAMTTPGDTSMASLKEVDRVVKGGGSRVDR